MAMRTSRFSAFIKTLCLSNPPGMVFPEKLARPIGSFGKPKKFVSNFPLLFISWYALRKYSPAGSVTFAVIVSLFVSSLRVLMTVFFSWIPLNCRLLQRVCLF